MCLEFHCMYIIVAKMNKVGVQMHLDLNQTLEIIVKMTNYFTIGLSVSGGRAEKLISKLCENLPGQIMFRLWFLAPLAVGQRAYVMVHCPPCVRLCVNFFFKHLLL